jgi:hypothetical protein
VTSRSTRGWISMKDIGKCWIQDSMPSETVLHVEVVHNYAN